MIKRPRGTNDILDSYIWQYVEEKIHYIASLYGFKEIRTPVFEHTELFKRGIGDTTDVVQKEMYTFEDKSNRSITLRPEGTAPAVRAFIENGLVSNPAPHKLYYIMSCYRYEKPGEGRLREFHQFGAELLGCPDVSADAEAIAFIMQLLDVLKTKSEMKLLINSVGCFECRSKYDIVLKRALELKLGELCLTCNDRYNRNPMRIFDCKVEGCKEIVKTLPLLKDYICEPCLEHFKQLKKSLSNLGIAYIEDPYIVRGLDYYTKTVFEIVNGGLTLCGGGRYDRLVEELGGKPTPAFGFALGLERLVSVIDKDCIKEKTPTVYVANIKEPEFAQKLTSDLRKEGIRTECDILGRAFRAQLKAADKLKASYLIVIGETEVKTGMVNLKNMITGETKLIKAAEIPNVL